MAINLKLSAIIYICFFNISWAGLAQADEPKVEEKFTITAYHPSPSGSYNEITTSSNTYLVTGSGNVGIGTSSPQGLLQVGTSPTPGLVVSSAGNVGIGTTAGTYQLFVEGELYVSGALSCDPSSVKENPREDPSNGFTGLLQMAKADTGNLCTATVVNGIIKASSCGRNSE
jgi:hypothetical protein